MLKKIYQLLQTLFFSNNKIFYSWDKYGCSWIIQFKNGQQYWVLERNKVIRNAGYYQPYRKIFVLKKLIQGEDLCQKI